MSGIFAVVGPSGVGKDTLMEAAKERLDVHLVRRVITRPEAAGGEAFEGVTPDVFAARQAAGAFALSWEAHGLSYGIPKAETEGYQSERTVVFNGSRAMLLQAADVFRELRVLSITASDEVLAARLRGRGRETDEDIARRLERAKLPLPEGLQVIEIDNSGALNEAVDALVAALGEGEDR